MCHCVFFFQAEDGIRDLVRSRGLGDVYKSQGKVEGLVGYARRNFMVPVPVFADFEALNADLLELSLIHI